MIAVVVLLLSAPSALADSVTGSGAAGMFGDVKIDVTSGPTGEHPSGQVTMKWNALLYSSGGLDPNEPGKPMYTGGPVTCLAVRDNVAVFNYKPVPELTLPEMVSFGVTRVEITDNARSGKPDTIKSSPVKRAPGDCSPIKWGDFSQKFIPGDVVVVDSTPPPTYAASCKQAGGRKVGRGHKRKCVPVRASACKGNAYKRKFGFKKRSRCVAAARRARPAR